MALDDFAIAFAEAARDARHPRRRGAVQVRGDVKRIVRRAEGVLMPRLPSLLAAKYRPATDREVHSWSFGAVKAPRDPNADSWQSRRGTLDDQAIFGPLRDFCCACGKYQGPRYRNMICDRCGVKVTTREVRHQRFGYIDLPVSVPHPFGEADEELSAVPVMPATFWQAPAGEGLSQAYDELARDINSAVCKALAAGSVNLPDWTPQRAREVLAPALARLVDLLLPVAIFAHEWDLAESQTLARGLVLENRENRADELYE
jgi:hypothetical protein